jgi:glyoxylase-like metal-dependent hydrolase (beta-lactamase superfamily II)
MLLGMQVPTVYIVPVERFCRELGHALGLNFAEFEFPAYFNFFVKQKRIQLVVDSMDAEQDIRTVFEETLLGPVMFRNHNHPCENANEDFDPSFPKDARPNFYKEFFNFRTTEGSSSELSTDTLLEFIHFKRNRHPYRNRRESRGKLGVPPISPNERVRSVVDRRHLTNVNEREGGFKQMPTVTTSLRRNSAIDAQQLQQLTSDDIGVRTSEKELVRGVRRNLSDDGLVIKRSSHNRSDSESPGSLILSNASLTDLRSVTSEGDVVAAAMHASAPSLLDKSLMVPAGRRDSAVSFDSDLTGDQGARESRCARNSRLSAESSTFADFNYDFLDDADDLQDSHWMYSQAKWLGEVATVYPPDATEEQRRSNSTARVEIFKMAGGTEYIVHDVDEKNFIVGKARFSGTVRVPDKRAVRELLCSGEAPVPQECDCLGIESVEVIQRHSECSEKTFHAPSFGVTVLGNSHGFDKNGNTSGYVLWVNGRGIMIDPPPYSSSALEMEGIRPQTIIAIIITHCHADHDAGAFQKIVTGARVAIITTPTIYKSFIRKYSALSGLSSSLLRHSHRFRPAIIGQPLKMQGAVFYFTYTLHTIPCISFKVEWRGRSIVFTGDHMNIPEQIQVLEEQVSLFDTTTFNKRKASSFVL